MDILFDSWQKQYDDSKYPRQLYFDSIERIAATKSPEDMGEAIIAMLHWKDGKVVQDPSGKYTYNKAKPNTYSPEKHGAILKSEPFFLWAKTVVSCKQFNQQDLSSLTDEWKLWDSGALVIPAFVLHLLAPGYYPLYDQHVERARRLLMAESLEGKLTTESYLLYRDFFYRLVPNPDIHSIKRADEALWSLGKWLKGHKKIAETSGSASMLHPIQAGEVPDTYRPDEQFKRRVMTLITSGLSQSNAMKQAADEYHVILADSYYRYPGSYIYAWRKQGF